MHNFSSQGTWNEVLKEKGWYCFVTVKTSLSNFLIKQLLKWHFVNACSWSTKMKQPGQTLNQQNNQIQWWNPPAGSKVVLDSHRSEMLMATDSLNSWTAVF